MNEVIAMLDKLHMWQVTMVMSVALLILGFTGEGVTGFHIIEGKEDWAIVAGLAFMGISVLLRYLPPPNRRTASSDRPRVAISAQQMALCSSFTEWTDFSDASQAVVPDNKLPLKELRKKNVELRLELGTLQGLLKRRVSDAGNHQVCYRYDDTTGFVDADVVERLE